MEALQSQHRKEQRDLQSRITQKKKNATKKTRKGVNDECESLERELKDRQQAELDAMTGGTGEDDVDVVNGVKDLNLNNEEEATLHGTQPPPTDLQPTSEDNTTHLSSTTTSTAPPKKRNRQKERLARRTAEQDAAIAAAESEAASMPDQRELELHAMAAQLTKLGLEEISIRPDGHCLYASVAVLLPACSVAEGVAAEGAGKATYQTVRSAAAGFILRHAEEFVPFLEEGVESYTRKIRDTAEWGGAVELQALARAYGVEINVLTSDGRVERIGEEVGEKVIWLAYYRHSFGLGEHYNALKRKTGVDGE